MLEWESKTVFRNQFRMGANLFSFSQFSCEKLTRFAPSKSVSGFSDGVTTRYYIFFLSVFSLSIYYYYYAALKKKRTTYLHRTITWWRWRPPTLILNHAETWQGLGWHWQKEYHRVAGVSACRFNATATKKAQVITPKTHLVSLSALIQCNK
jgi:hypothetical protein